MPGTAEMGGPQRHSVSRVLREPRIEVELSLRDCQPDLEWLPAHLRNRIVTDDGFVEPPALEIEQSLRLECQLPASLLPHRVAELRLRQPRQCGHPGARAHQV